MPATNVNWQAPLTRLNPWYPGQMGVPGTDSETGLRLNTEGKILWVDPNHPDPNDNRDGTNPDSPMATIDAAVGKCRPYRGDVIAVMHNGYWTYGDMASDNITPIQETVTIDVPGIRLVGISPSPLGVPWIGTANNDELITVTALDVTIEGFNFWEPTYTGVTGISAVWGGTGYGENLHVRHCNFYDLAYGIQADYIWNSIIEDCWFMDISTAAIHNPSVQGEPDYLVVKGCKFTSCVSAINLPDCEYVLIERNRFQQCGLAITMIAADFTPYYNTIAHNTIQGAPAGVNNMINLTGGADNLVCDNWLSCTIAQYDTTCSDATSGSWVNNHCTNGDTTAPPT